MIFRRGTGVVIAALVLAVVTGCTPGTTPSASPTPSFSSSAQAFAAAEATYRAYVDALNKVDLSDPKTFEGIYAWTTGDANAQDRKSFSKMHADGWSVSGKSNYDHFQESSFRSSKDQVIEVTACLDVSLVEVTDSTGESVVPQTRRDHQPVKITFADANTSTGLAISQSVSTSDAACE